MPGSAAKVVISERQQAILQSLSRASTVAKCLVQRATLLLLAFAGLENRDIAAQVNLERHQVGLWRRRWQAAFPKFRTPYIGSVSSVFPVVFSTASSDNRERFRELFFSFRCV